MIERIENPDSDVGEGSDLEWKDDDDADDDDCNCCDLTNVDSFDDWKSLLKWNNATADSFVRKPYYSGQSGRTQRRHKLKQSKQAEQVEQDNKQSKITNFFGATNENDEIVIEEEEDAGSDIEMNAAEQIPNHAPHYKQRKVYTQNELKPIIFWCKKKDFLTRLSSPEQMPMVGGQMMILSNS